VAIRLRLSPIVGYIVAGIVIGPFTPGFVGDAEIVGALAEIGVIFLMFAIGAQISLPDLARVGRLAISGAVSQVLIVIGLGYGIGLAIGLTSIEALFLGAVASNSSSTVLGKVLGERGETETEHGHTGLAWSTVQDLGTIVLIVVLTSLATASGNVAMELAIAMAKAIGFLFLSLVVGSRVVPAIFEFLATFRSREVFVLGVVALALGTAYAASLFGISLALGAFLAGLVIAESDLSNQVVGEALPFRDLFAGLFFVSVGMLVDPMFVVQNLPAVALILVLIVVVKGTVVALLARVFGRPWPSAVLIGAVLAQSAEFSFLMARVGVDIGAVGGEAFSLMLGAAAASVVLAAPVMSLGHRLARWPERDTEPEVISPMGSAGDRRRRAVICGYGRAGQVVAAALERRGFRFTVIEMDRRVVEDLRARGIPTIRGSAANRIALERADLGQAVVLVIAVPDSLTVRFVVEEARRLNPRLPIIARTHGPGEQTTLRRLGATETVVAETELGLELTRFALRQFGVSQTEAQAIVAGLRPRG
jgi:monovalent cation:H+ antiporter-2, CPA2 family